MILSWNTPLTRCSRRFHRASATPPPAIVRSYQRSRNLSRIKRVEMKMQSAIRTNRSEAIKNIGADGWR